MFIVTLTYKVDLSIADTILAEHLAYVQIYHDKGTYIISGPQVPRTGGILIAANVSRAEIEEIVKNDPYNIKNIADFTITEFRPTRFEERFNDLV